MTSAIHAAPKEAPLIVGLGGTLRTGSSTEKALRWVLNAAQKCGASTLLLDGGALDLPLYAAHLSRRHERAKALIRALRRSDGVILASPGYHGSLSGQMKNALDYIEDMRADERPYLEGRAVGCIATAAGWQGAVTTLTALRSVVHALRGWPTPLGAAINTAECVFDEQGVCVAPKVGETLEALASQVVGFARWARKESGAATQST